MEQKFRKLTPEQMTVFNHIGDQTEQGRAGLAVLMPLVAAGKLF